jgi:hypothetical protein
MLLADAALADEDDGLAVVDQGAVGERGDRRLRHRGVVVEAEVLEPLQQREAGASNRRFVSSLFAMASGTVMSAERCNEPYGAGQVSSSRGQTRATRHRRAEIRRDKGSWRLAHPISDETALVGAEYEREGAGNWLDRVIGDALNGVFAEESPPPWEELVARLGDAVRETRGESEQPDLSQDQDVRE